MDSTTTTAMLLDSTATHTRYGRSDGRGGSVCTDTDVGSDMTSDITSTSGLNHGSLADYQMERLLGRGKYSQVYLARELRTGRLVAIKRVEIFDMMDSAGRQACVKEVKILQNVEHPNIVACWGSFLADNELVIVLEWAEAGDLGQLIRGRAEAGQPFSTEQVWLQFQQVCSALRHMHDRRMMHRDLKPSNIFVTAGGDLKLGDLGLSRYFSSRTLQAQTTVGTPYYMSPEVVRGQPYDFSSDIWSLGCLLYELIALRNPFYKENQSLYVLGKSIQSCTYEPLPPSAPEALRELVGRMLQPQPASRPPIGQLADYVNAHIAQHLPHLLPRTHLPAHSHSHAHAQPQHYPPHPLAHPLQPQQSLHQHHQHHQQQQQQQQQQQPHPHGGGSRVASATSQRAGSSAGGGGGAGGGSGAGGDLELGVTGYSIQLSGRGLSSPLPR